MTDELCRINVVPGNFRKENLRITRSYNALLTALPKLLERRNFRQLTVNDLCDISQLSRTAFYTYFQDKYDLLKCWLKKTTTSIINIGCGYSCLERNVNEFVRENTKVIRNILEDADGETLDLVHDFVISLIDLPSDKESNLDPKYITLSTFCVGGIVNCLLWQVKKDFPSDVQMMNPELYIILDMLLQKKKNED